MKKVVIVAPFWRQPGHVGNNRIERYVRWLSEDGYHVVLLRAGSTTALRTKPWGTEVTVRDPLGIYRDEPAALDPSRPLKPKRFQRWLAYRLFIPDPTLPWAWTASQSTRAIDHCAGAALVLSSNPPESAHVAGRRLSRVLRSRHLIDMRDGWLDEPLKPLLCSSRSRRWLEARLEASLLRKAAAILVSSSSWRQLLIQRLPEVANKVTVLTNAYPCSEQIGARSNGGKPLTPGGLFLIHSGRFTGSQFTRSPELLLTPLLQGIEGSAHHGAIALAGMLSIDECAIVDKYQPRFNASNWSIALPGQMPRRELLASLQAASGLLLLCTYAANLPAKLFEYIQARRPILVVAKEGSATWQLCQELPQAFCVAVGASNPAGIVRAFLDASTRPNPAWACPEEHSEPYLREVLRGVIESLVVDKRYPSS
jgi:hypothetical protein